MSNKNEYKPEEQLYDPEIVSVLISVLGAIGGLGGIVGALDFLDRKLAKKKEHHFTEKRRKDIELEISYSFRNISISIDSIGRRLEFINRICQVPSENGKNFSDSIFSFGNCSILLNDFQFRAYQNEQNAIMKEIIEINNNISIIEGLIAEIPHLVDNADSIINKKLIIQLKQTISEINSLMREFGKITINEFLSRTIRLCQNIEVINKLKEDRRNFL